MSLLLEALDFAAPIIMQFCRKASQAVSWLLVALVGRSLGLVFRGIRQSLGLRPRRSRREDQTPDTYTVI